MEVAPKGANPGDIDARPERIYRIHVEDIARELEAEFIDRPRIEDVIFAKHQSVIVQRDIETRRRRELAANIARADARAMLAVVSQIVAEEQLIPLAESMIETEAAGALRLLERER